MMASPLSTTAQKTYQQALTKFTIPASGMNRYTETVAYSRKAGRLGDAPPPLAWREIFCRHCLNNEIDWLIDKGLTALSAQIGYVVSLKSTGVLPLKKWN